MFTPPTIMTTGLDVIIIKKHLPIKRKPTIIAKPCSLLKPSQ